MNGYRNQFVAIGVLVTASLQLLTCAGQSTAFTYQGRLNDGGAPASGIYDLQFTIYDSTNQPGTVIAGPITNTPTVVSNGLFAVALDFGAATFNGGDRWLEIAVRTNGAANFTTLAGRQPITPTPYALQALNASSVAASNISGAVPLAQLPPNLAVLNSNQTFNGANVFTQPTTFSNHVTIGGSIMGFLPLEVQGEAPYVNSGVIYAKQTGGNAGGAALYGVSTVPAGYGVFGESDTDGGPGNGHAAGVVGVTGTPDGIGVYGFAFYDSALAGQFIGNTYISSKLGIGTRFPSAPLEVTGTNAFPQLRVSVPFDSPYGAFLSIDASATTGGKDFLIFSSGNSAGEGQGKLIIQNHTDSLQIMGITSNGDVGIGTLSPQSRLQVVGNIQLGGGSGTNYAASGQENLRIVRGAVNSNGTLKRGSGFTPSRQALGTYSMTFDPPFSGVPTMTVSGTGFSARVPSVLAGGANIVTFNSTGATTDDTFQFIAIGPP